MNSLVKQVRISEVKLGHEGEILKALLGSCVGIAFVWRKRKICSLAHCLLPKSDRKREGVEAKYVDHAIVSSLQLLCAGPKDYDQLKAFVAGGGNMMSQLARPNVDHVGELNIKAAMEILDKMKIEYQLLDSGGDVGRQMYVDCNNAHVYVENFEKTG